VELDRSFYPLSKPRFQSTDQPKQATDTKKFNTVGKSFEIGKVSALGDKSVVGRWVLNNTVPKRFWTGDKSYRAEQMETSQIDIKSQVVELSKESFDTFCNEISTIFATTIKCSQQLITTETIPALKERFKKLVAVHSIKAEGALDGTFQIVFDQHGLFTLAGLLLMYPEQTILGNIELGSPEKANQMSDILTEAGHSLVGAWDRVFKKGFTGHNRFEHTDIFIGNPWNESEDKTDIFNNEESVFVPYEIEIGSYPPFNCGVIFPKTIPCATLESGTDDSALTDEKKQDQKPVVDETDSKESDPQQESNGEKAEAQEPPVQTESSEKIAQGQDIRDASVAEQNTDMTETQNAEEVVTAQDSNDTGKDAPADATDKKAAAQSSDIPPEEPACAAAPEPTPSDNIREVLAICAKDIMEEALLWGSQDDSVQQALEQMQQHNSTGYILIGQNGMLEGIVSKSDLTAAISPYVRPTFAKWRRSQDDATLQIKIKWIMTTDVHTVTPETSLAATIENMCQLGVRCLPVVGPQGEVQGLVTPYDIFKQLLKHNPDAPSVSDGSE
jgi:CBS domain-containing protein